MNLILIGMMAFIVPTRLICDLFFFLTFKTYFMIWKFKYYSLKYNIGIFIFFHLKLCLLLTTLSFEIYVLSNYFKFQWCISSFFRSIEASIRVPFLWWSTPREFCENQRDETGLKSWE